MADIMLRITGEWIATPVCGLVRNDMLVDSVCTYLAAESIENTVIARSKATWQSPVQLKDAVCTN